MHACAEPRPRSLQPEEASILLIETDDDASSAITDILERQHYRVHRSPDAQAGVEQLRAGLSADVIVVDLTSPCMTEWEFRALQQREPMLKAIPVIALSSDETLQHHVLDANAFVPRPIDERVLVDALRVTVDEVTQRRNEAQAAQQERLSALGVMAAGLAHEVNNPLASVLGNIELANRRCTELLHELEGPHAQILSNVIRYISEAHAGGSQIAEVVRGVATFARPDMECVAPLDVQAVLESSIRLAGNQIRHRARLERSYCQVPRVLGNAAKLGQVFLNLLINAVHAIGEEHRAGLLRVSIDSDGEHVDVCVEDNGHGMTPAVAARIFDPFFSTKACGRGMGLGLALSQRSVQAMGGTIHVASESGKGTVFHVVLPVHASQVNLRPTSEATTGLVMALPRTRQRLLVIDDEEMMCRMLASTLGDLYEVTTSIDSRSMLNELVSGQAFDVILCDLMMPVLSGMDLHRELLRLRPELASRMLFMTGGTFTESARVFLDDGSCQYIRKPFAIEDVLRLLRSVAPVARAGAVSGSEARSRLQRTN